MNDRIIAIRDHPEYAAIGIDYFAAKWGIDRHEYEMSFDDCLHTAESLPRWYLMFDEANRIIGSYGLIQNDFVDRTDLYPYLCALYVEQDRRGQALGSVLLANGRREAARLGFARLYLCTDHIGYYEKYGWRHIGAGHHPDGSTSRIYEADTMSSQEQSKEQSKE